MTIRLLTSISKGWLHAEGGFSFDEPYYLDPLYRQAQDIKIDLFLRERWPDYAFYNMESNLVQREFWQPDYVYVGGIQPNLLVGACVGARLKFYPDKDIDFAAINPLGHISTVDELPPVADILSHPLIQRFDAQIIELRETRPDLTVIPPFFWDTSGRATVHGFITTSMKFYSENIFVKMYEEPDFVKGFHDWIADVYIALIRHYAELGHMPVTSIHTGECTGTMVRDNQYDEFIIPYINKLADALGPIRLHSCGQSDHLLQVMPHIHNLEVLDTGSGTSLAKVRETLGAEIRIDLAPPLNLLLEGSAKTEMVNWLDRALAENGGGPLLIGYHFEPGYSMENCLAIHDELAERGLIKKGRS
ncbi:MAG: uroporphyrinogen decarboxylase family protein [Anaerolineae bacterium]|nr:uroporphyrinogen decarboxylase family protein [Anaerolineae bacterium]